MGLFYNCKYTINSSNSAEKNEVVYIYQNVEEK